MRPRSTPSRCIARAAPYIFVNAIALAALSSPIALFGGDKSINIRDFWSLSDGDRREGGK